METREMDAIALINPPSPYLANDQAYPPSGLLYLAGKLESLGVYVEVIDLAGGHKLPNLEWADAIGITCVTPNAPQVQRLIPELPEGRPILVGGPHPTWLPEHVKQWSDAHHPQVIPIGGDGEAVIERVVRDYAKGELEQAYYGGIADLADVAHPARHLVDLRRYTPGGWAGSTVVYASRGCPYSCRFCSKTSGSTYRGFSVDWIESEILECKALGFKRIVLGDDNLMGSRAHLKSLLRMLGRHGIEYRLNRDVRGLSSEVMELAASTGCVSISFGIESGSQRMLDNMNKQTTVEQNEYALRVAKDSGVRTKAYLVVNFPGETEDSIDETIGFIRRVHPDEVLTSSFAPLPGSHVFAHPEKYGIHWLSDAWGDYFLVGNEAPRATFETPELTAEKQTENWIRLTEGLRACGY